MCQLVLIFSDHFFHAMATIFFFEFFPANIRHQPNVSPPSTTLAQHWIDVSCLLGEISPYSRKCKLFPGDYCDPNHANGQYPSKTNYVPIFLRYWLNFDPYVTTLFCYLPCTAKRRYMLTLQVSRYCILALQADQYYTVYCTYMAGWF